jgi:hypothetical protein
VTLRDGADNVVYSYRIGDASLREVISIDVNPSLSLTRNPSKQPTTVSSLVDLLTIFLSKI